MSQGRKADHLRICTEMDVEFRRQSTWLEHIRLVHAALAEVSFDEISTETRFMGRPLRAPLMITAISGGLQAAQALNRDLAKVAQQLGIAFGLGSQRPMLEDPGLIGSYALRRFAPDIPILGNIGLQQAAAADPSDVERLVASIQADGLAIHLNPAQELSQSEGDKRFIGGLKTLRSLTRRMPGKIMVKETGCGISREVARRLKAAGVRTLDVAGAGGTSWPRVENLRKGVDPAQRSWLDDWGIPTAASLWETSPLGFELVASGGIRDGLDAAKCLVLGADVVGLALPVLRAYRRGGYGGALACLQDVIAELKAVMLLVGARDIPALKRHKPVITGQLREWINNRSRKPR
ncbi:MAG: type 2 isopentenyl-diphosphate Delta-isomerase [Elusimicrobia bacterium]|nr:type 2 isopentenyl-diphosphate Delta-isomerase [Elusimicrobiota bacterium]